MANPIFRPRKWAANVTELVPRFTKKELSYRAKNDGIGFLSPNYTWINPLRLSKSRAFNDLIE